MTAAPPNVTPTRKSRLHLLTLISALVAAVAMAAVGALILLVRLPPATDSPDAPIVLVPPQVQIVSVSASNGLQVVRLRLSDPGWGISKCFPKQEWPATTPPMLMDDSGLRAPSSQTLVYKPEGPEQSISVYAVRYIAGLRGLRMRIRDAWRKKSLSPLTRAIHDENYVLTSPPVKNILAGDRQAARTGSANAQP